MAAEILQAFGEVDAVFVGEGELTDYLGLFKSTNGGERWSPANSGLPTNSAVSVSALAIDPATPTTLYAAIGGVVFKSTDGGGSYFGLSSPDPHVVVIWLLPC